jgi:hypothetical protein
VLQITLSDGLAARRSRCTLRATKKLPRAAPLGRFLAQGRPLARNSLWNSLCQSLFGFASALLASTACMAADLTPTEVRWLNGVWPVVQVVQVVQVVHVAKAAKAAKFPLDIVVQPQASLGAAPLALAFVDGRCKLVLSLRGNTEAQATLDRIQPDALDATLQLMAAHERGHCRRYLDGAWHGVPTGFAARVPRVADPALRAAAEQMRAERREEGCADLVGLAWTLKHHPRHCATLRQWLVTERSRDLIESSPHDTLVWVRQAACARALAHDSIFDGPAIVWARALADNEE